MVTLQCHDPSLRHCSGVVLVRGAIGSGGVGPQSWHGSQRGGFGSRHRGGVPTLATRVESVVNHPGARPWGRCGCRSGNFDSGGRALASVAWVTGQATRLVHACVCVVFEDDCRVFLYISYIIRNYIISRTSVCFKIISSYSFFFIV